MRDMIPLTMLLLLTVACGDSHRPTAPTTVADTTRPGSAGPALPDPSQTAIAGTYVFVHTPAFRGPDSIRSWRLVLEPEGNAVAIVDGAPELTGQFTVTGANVSFRFQYGQLAARARVEDGQLVVALDPVFIARAGGQVSFENAVFTRVAVTRGSGGEYVFLDSLFPYTASYTRSSRFFLYPDGTFALRYHHVATDYAGVYHRAGDVLTLRFESDARWVAAGTLRDDILTVRYSAEMGLSDFEDARYLRVGEAR